MDPRLFQILFGNTFNLNSFMASQSDGLYYNFTKTDRLFKEREGLTAASSISDVIGLAADQRLWGGHTLAEVALSKPNLVPNSTFDTNITGWPVYGTAAGVWSSFAGGSLFITRTASVGFQGNRTDQILISGAFYKVTGRVYRPSGSDATAAVSLNVSIGAMVTPPTDDAWHDFTAYLSADSGLRAQIYTASGSIGATMYFDDIAVQLIGGNPGTQASGSLKGTFQTSGIKFDGTDDYLGVTNYSAGSGSNFLIALITAPASPTSQIIAGERSTADTRFYLGFDGSGRAGGGVGADSSITIFGGDVLSGAANIVLGLSFDGSTVRLFSKDQLVYEGAQSGSPDTSVNLTLGALNNNGVTASFYSGYIKKFVAGREFLSLSRYLQIRNALLAA